MSRLFNMMEQIKKLKNGVGVQSLLDAGYKILGNPIVMFNTEYNLLAHTEAATDDSLWNEIVTTGTFCRDTQKLFEVEGFIEDMANSPRSLFMISDKLKYDRICGKVLNKNNSHVANLVAVACDRLFEDGDQMVFEAICKLISREISRSEFYQEYEQSHQEAIVKSLIDGNYDMRLDIGQVGIIYDSLESRLYVAVVDVSLCDPKCANIEYFRDLLKQTEPAYKYAIYANRIIIIISTNDDVINVNKALDKLIKIFDQNNMYAGISREFENLFELQKHYAEALKALQYVFEVKSTQRIFPCNKDSMDKIEKIKQLPNGKGIQYFLNIGPEIFVNPILFHDMELNLLGYTENMEISDPIWQELITYGTSSDETIELFRSENYIDIMDNTKGGALLVSEKIKHDRISWRIYNSDNIRIGCTSIVNTIKPFTEDELVLFGTFSQKFSKEVGKIEFYNNYGQVYSETIINRLISGKIDNYAFYSDDIGNLYDNFMENLYLLVIDTTQCESEQFNLTYFRELFNLPGTVNRYAIHDDRIVIIISADSVPPNKIMGFNKISEAFERNNIYAGISSCFGNMYELQKYHTEAADALKFGIENAGHNSKQRIFQYSEADNA